MKLIELNIEVDQAFGNLHRDRCVLIAVKDKDDKLLSGAKPGFFPPTITRLLGGGLDKGERPEAAAIRELSEELGVELSVEDLEPIAKFITNAVDRDGKEYKNETYLYGAKLKDQKYRPGDDVKQIITLSKDETLQLADSFESLPACLWYIGEEGDFSWSDYGKMYGPIHRVAVEYL